MSPLRRQAPFFISLLGLAGTSVSAYMLFEYVQPGPMQCGGSGGCEAVRHCSMSHVGPLSWPLLGLACFTLFTALSALAKPTARRLLGFGGLAAAVIGIGLIVTQRAVCGAWCPYCLTADTAGILAGLLAFWTREDRIESLPPSSVVKPSAALGFVAMIVAGYGLLVASDAAARAAAAPVPEVDAPLPSIIEDLQQPGVATIVEFADFECPFCRRMNEQLEPVVASYGPRVRFLRKHLPLSFHAHAEIAARATLCAEEQGRGERMASALMREEPETFTVERFTALGTQMGIDTGALQACLNAERTTQRLVRDREDATRARVEGLPTTYVGRKRFDGVVPEHQLREAIDRALAESAAPPAQAAPRDAGAPNG